MQYRMEVYSATTHDGMFRFMIIDSFGDVLLPTQGDGSYAIFYVEEEISSPFSNPKKKRISCLIILKNVQ